MSVRTAKLAFPEFARVTVVAEVVHSGRARLLANAGVRDGEGNLVAQAHAALLPSKAQLKAATEGTTTP